MNLDDLRSELESRSQDIDWSEPDLRSGVQRKIRTTRHRRVAVVASTAAAAIALVIAAPGMLDDGSRPDNPIDRPAPPGVIVSPPPGDVTSEGVTYRKTFGGRTLLAAVIGNPGQHSVTLRWKVSSTNVVVYEYCSDPGAPQPRNTPNELPWVELSRDRQPLGAAGPCTPPSVQDPAMLPAHARDLGLSRMEQRRPVTVGSTLELTYMFKKSAVPGGMQPSSKARLGLAIYELGEEQQVAGGALPVVEEIDGTNYRLTTFRSAAVQQGATVSIPTPAGRRFILRLGGSGVGFRFRLEGIYPVGVRYPGSEEDGSFTFVGPSFGTMDVPVETRIVGFAEMRVVSSPPGRGTMFIALYEPDR
jgi:hypothetical protein